MGQKSPPPFSCPGLAGERARRDFGLSPSEDGQSPCWGGLLGTWDVGRGVWGCGIHVVVLSQILGSVVVSTA